MGSESSYLRHVKVVLHSQWGQGVQESVWDGVEACVNPALWYPGLVNHRFQGLGLGSSVTT